VAGKRLSDPRSWASRMRALHYQHQAGLLRKMAESEPNRRLHRQLINLAQRFEHAADRLTPTETSETIA
jgi:hypothetical protein